MMSGSYRDGVRIDPGVIEDGALGDAVSWPVEGPTLFAEVALIDTLAQARYQQTLNLRITHRVKFQSEQEIGMHDRLVWASKHGPVVLFPIEPARVDAFGRWALVLCRDETEAPALDPVEDAEDGS